MTKISVYSLSSFVDLSFSVHLQNTHIHHHQSQSKIQLILITGCPELFHLAGLTNKSL